MPKTSSTGTCQDTGCSARRRAKSGSRSSGGRDQKAIVESSSTAPILCPATGSVARRAPCVRAWCPGMQAGIASRGQVVEREGPARREAAAWDLGVLVAANAVVVVGLWWRQGGLREIHDAASALTSAGRVTGMVGTY